MLEKSQYQNLTNTESKENYRLVYLIKTVT